MTLDDLHEQLDRLHRSFGDFTAQEVRERTPAVKALWQQIDEVMTAIEQHPDWRNFEADCRLAFTDRIEDDLELAADLYAALCNVDWIHEKGTVYSCTWRHAGAFVARLRHKGEDYLDFYCSGHEGWVSPEITATLAKFGWEPQVYHFDLISEYDEVVT